MVECGMVGCRIPAVCNVKSPIGFGSENGYFYLKKLFSYLICVSKTITSRGVKKYDDILGCQESPAPKIFKIYNFLKMSRMP